jgi:hypothetical protein
MSSDQQIAANRSNAQKSTGPRSKAGREVSRRNARRHGLAIDIGADPAFHDDIEKLAKELSRFSGSHESSRLAAEAHIDLSRIRKVRVWLFERFYLSDASLPDSLAELNQQLAKLERYEHGAVSRRNRAMRAMYGGAAPARSEDAA